MKKIIPACILAASLLFGCAAPLDGETSGPTTGPQQSVPGTTVPETTVPITTVPETTVPETTVPITTVPETTVPETTAAETTLPVGELIGNLYTRDYLMELDNTRMEFGCGYPAGGNPPAECVRCQDKYGKYDAHFLLEDSRAVFLTFNCGYEPVFTDGQGSKIRYTEKILDTLKEKGVRAAFFLNLQFCKTAPDLVRRMIDEGHIVGNHTASHSSLPELTIDRGVEDILLLQAYLQEHFGYTMHLFRPGAGVYSERTLALAQSLGFTTVQWSVAYRDWDVDDQPPVAKSLQTMVNRAHGGAIYLFHSLSSTNAAIMGDFIDALQSKGYTFAVLGQ